MKPGKFDIKVWMLADADNYYVPQFQVYLGKNRKNSELFQRRGLGYYVIWTLGEPYLDNHRHFFFDNFFTSAELMRDLESRDTYACGTVRTNRRDFPADLKRQKLVVGEIRTRQYENYWQRCRKTNVLFLCYRQILLQNLKFTPFSRLCGEEESEWFPPRR